jgi:hypothetical protein
MSYILDLMLALGVLFFLFLPITDRRTVIMKLGMIVATMALLAVSLTSPHGTGPEARSAQAQSVKGG